MSSAICFDLDQSKILLSGNGLKWLHVPPLSISGELPFVNKSNSLSCLIAKIFQKDKERGINKGKQKRLKFLSERCRESTLNRPDCQNEMQHILPTAWVG